MRRGKVSSGADHCGLIGEGMVRVPLTTFASDGVCSGAWGLCMPA